MPEPVTARKPSFGGGIEAGKNYRFCGGKSSGDAPFCRGAYGKN